MTRTATAVREGRFWVVDVPGIGVTQGRSVREASHGRDLVEAMTGKAEEVDVHVELPADVREAVDHARAMAAEAKRLTSIAADEHRQAVRDLVVERGMSKADVAALLNMSQQRVSQLAP